MKKFKLMPQRKQIKVLMLVPLVTVLLFALVGCGTNPTTPTSVDEPQQEYVLNVARDWEKTNMDPATWSTNEDLTFGPSVFQRMLNYDNDLNFIGELTEDWEVSEDFTVFRFFLRKGVEFHHDYGEMKASDVVFTFERMSDPELNATSVSSGVGIENFKEIVAEDEYTVKITLNEKDINFLHKIANWYGYVVSEKAVTEMGNTGFAQKPVGTGPYAFDKGVAGERTEVVKFDKYWGETAKLDRIIFHVISEPATLFNAFESGEIDFVAITDTDKLLEYRAQPEKYYIDSVPGRQLLYVGVNYQNEFFKNEKVREAFAYAINRDEIIEDHFLNLEEHAKGVIPELSKFSVNNVWKPVYDLEKAKALLAEAGYPDGFETEFYCPNDHLSMGPATLVQYYLGQAGIKADLKGVDFGVFLDAVKTNNAPIWLLYNSTGIIPDETLKRYRSSESPGRNWCGLTDPAYDELVDKFLAAQTEEEKKEYAQKAQVYLTQKGVLYPISTYTQHSVMHKKVKGFYMGGSLATSFEHVYIEE